VKGKKKKDESFGKDVVLVSAYPNTIFYYNRVYSTPHEKGKVCTCTYIKKTLIFSILPLMLEHRC